MSRSEAPRKPASNPRLGIRLFGHVKIEVDGAPFHLATPRRTLALLTYLVLHRTTAVERDFISYTLWPDDDEGAARTKLRGTLYDLLRVLPPSTDGWFDVGSDSIRWKAGTDVEVDIERFETLARDPATLREAVDLYRGDLAEALYDEWIDEPRERLRTLYLTSLDKLAADARRARDFGLAISCAQRILALDPWREDVVRRLISARYDSGDAAGALAEYAGFASRLRAEIGVDPMPETLALRDAVARHAELAAEPAPIVNPAPRRDAAALPFVGRQAESEKLDAAWRAAAAGRGGLAIVGGEAGIGKSRLVLDFAARVSEGGGRVMIGATARPESTPYQPIVEALRSALPLVAALTLDHASTAVLASLLPELRAREDARALPELAGERERERTFSAVARALMLLAKPRPLLLVLEDLHCAGEATLALLEFVLRQLAGSRVLILATVREGEPPASRLLERVRRDASARDASTEVFLRGLAPAEAARLVEMRVGDPALAAAICERAEGHPLYLGQLVESAIEGSFDPAASSLQALLAARTAHVSIEARAAGEIVATIGRSFPSSMLGAVAGWSDAEARAALGELVSHRIVREVPGRGLFDFAFTHQLLADAFLTNSREERKRDRHHRIAVNFESLFPNDFDELAPSIARHYDDAGEPSAAAPHYLAAGRRALRVGALHEAAKLLRRCADIAPDNARRAEALLEFDRACHSLGDSAARTTTIAELEALARRADDPELSFLVAERRYFKANQDCEAHVALLALDDMRSAAARLGSERLLALTDLWQVVNVARDTGGEELLGAALAVAARMAELGQPEWESHALAQAALYAAGILRHAEAVELIARSEAAAVRSGSRAAMIFLVRKSHHTATRLGDAALGERWVKRWMDLANDAGNPFEAACALEASGWCLAHSGRPGEAIAAVREALAIYVAHGVIESIQIANANLASLYLRVGAFDDAIASITASDDIAAPADASQSTYRASLLSHAFALAGRYEEALELGREALEHGSRLGNARRLITVYERLAHAELGRGEYASALEFLTSALALCDGAEDTRSRKFALALTAFARMRLGEPQTARRAIDEMLRGESYDTGVTEWPQRCDWIAALVMRATAEPQRANELLERAHARTMAESSVLEEPYRSTFLALPWHREILAAAERGEWPD